MQSFAAKEKEVAATTRLLNGEGHPISLAHAIDNLSQAFSTARHFLQEPEIIAPNDLDIYKPENRTPTALQKGVGLGEELSKIATWLTLEATEIPPPTRLQVTQTLQRAYDFLNPDDARAIRHRDTVVKAFEVFQLGEVPSQKSARG